MAESKYSVGRLPIAGAVAMTMIDGETRPATVADLGYNIELTLPGRRGAGQIDALLTKSGLVQLGNQNTHHPFLVFVMAADDCTDGSLSVRVAVKLIRDAREVAKLPAETPVMVQWPGSYRSDWFNTTAGVIADWLSEVGGKSLPAATSCTPETAFFLDGRCVNCGLRPPEHPSDKEPISSERQRDNLTVQAAVCNRRTMVGIAGVCVKCGQDESSHGE